ncbi:SusC/RagA family TonB-linked outer membrane protein [Marinigracilibium pacificum]|uniref:TonB-dependent receptor n=1 Tax=Marinigracilibium pacificum TaxID=2729599 RepID=A0A848J1F2_9BACT|nr:TonB-dependent receptor [Marinigracilibium pacificum]NMM49345.1 TonB-dependent receptor [Marinigracilibium pacificum]
MRKSLLLFSTFLFLVFQTMGQDVSITGKVVDVAGEGIPGVNVLIKGTTIGTTTDVSGSYSVSAPGDAILVFTSVGYTKQEIAVNNQTTINITLEEDISELSEVVVTGYRSVKKSDLTSSIAVVDGDNLTQQPIGSVDNLLQGQSPGVLAVSQNGRPGGNAYIRIRGVGSVNASNEPLFIIDGIQMTQSDYNALNPNDIQSISILKDAASTSIYGARASNGVVLITTKSGAAEKGKPTITYKFQFGQKEKIPDNFDMMNKEEKLAYEVATGGMSQATADFVSTSPAYPETDWQDVLLRTGQVQSHDLSLASTTDRAKYFFSLGSYDEEGISVGSNFERLSGRLNLEFKTTDWLTFGNNLTVSQTKERETRDRFNVQNPFYAIYAYNPYESEFQLDANGDFVLDENGDKVYNLTRQGFSISEALRNNPESNERLSAIGGVFARITPIEGLVYTSRVSMNYQIYRREYYIQPNSVLDGYVGDPNAPGIKTDNGYDRSLTTWTNTLEYTFKPMGNHNINVLGGTEYVKSRLEQYSISGKGFPSEDFFTQDNASEITGGFTSIDEWALWSQFLNVNYNFGEKYFVTGSVRRDGSSRFGADNRYGIFYAGSFGWNMTEEGFLNDVSWLEQLKFRASAGTSGNVPTSLYAALGYYNIGNYNNTSASFPGQLENPNLQWEENFNYSVGIDFGLWNNRLSGSFDYYNRDTYNLLFPRPLSQTVGFTSRTENVGKIKNSGIELELNAIVVDQGDFKFNIFGSYSTVKNEVLELDNGGEDIIDGNSGISLLREGLTANTYYLVRYAGVDPDNGDALYYDINGEITNVHSYDDAVALEGKSPLPTYFGNFGFNSSWKGLSLNVNFFYQGGNYIYNYQNEAVLMSDGSNYNINQRKDALNYWKNPGDTGVLPRPDANNDIYDSDRYLQKGDFIRLRNVTLAYSLPKSLIEKAKLSNVEFYVQGTNLLTINPHFTGDPEVGRGSDESNLTTLGEFTLFTYPNTRGYTAGVNVTF